MRRTLAITLALGLTVFGASRALAAEVSVHAYPTDLAGNPISSVLVGQQYKLQVDVQDIRDPAPQFSGVFAAYTDISYTNAFTSVSGPIVHDPFFQIVPLGNTAVAGSITGAGGASQAFDAPGNAVQHLLSILFTADAQGVVSFTPSFDALPNHDVLLYGVDNIIGVDQIQFSGSRLAIVPEPGAMALAGSACAVMGIAGLVRRRSRRLLSERLS